MVGESDRIDIGITLTQQGIEDAFNTGFGYQISGINPRRDTDNERYILLFANENGPYDDTVQAGKFEYIGEGLEGDQSETSPGNSALIDAISSDMPVHFFYKSESKSEWEYQGLLDVLRYAIEERGGRDVLVFTMEHRQQSNSDSKRNGLYLIPVNTQWRERFRKTVETPADLTRYKNLHPKLEGSTEVRIWGTTKTESSKKQAAIEQMQSGDCLLYYHDGRFIAGGRINDVFESPDVGDTLWDNPESRYLYTIYDFTTDVPTIDRVWDLLGYKGRQVVQGFTRVSDDRVSKLLGSGGSMEQTLFGANVGKPTEAEIDREKAELEDISEEDPQLTERSEEYTETRRRARDTAFTELILVIYDGTCAVCGSQRETPKGNSEAEAAHIYPKKKNGSDDPRNGIALCKLHHWAFDTGWLSVTNHYEVLVSDSPEANGYYEFKQLEGERLELPEDERMWPHPLFLTEHRHIHKFG